MATTKQLIRQDIASRLASSTPAALAAASRDACVRLIAHHAFAATSQVMLYAPIAGELDLSPIALAARARGIAVYLPRTSWTDRTMQPALAPPCDDAGNYTNLATGRHGIREPGPDAPAIDPATLDLILVPGLAFDASGGRLGRGAGFYHRFLANLRLRGGRATFVALAMDEQIVEGLPMDRHDVYMDLVLTPTRTLGPGTKL